MKIFMLDTSTCIEFVRGRKKEFLSIFNTHQPVQFCIPAVVEAELLYGVQRSGNPIREMSLVKRFLSPFEVVPFDSACASAYARLRAELAGRGRTIGANDLLIAATAAAHDAILVTDNEREFSRIKGLMVVHWQDISEL